MQTIDLIKEYLSHLLCCIGMLEGDEKAILSESINYHQYHILVMRHREALNEIHANMAPSKVRDRQWL